MKKEMVYSFLNIASTTDVTPYPSGRLNRSTYFKTMFDTTALPYNMNVNGCNNTFCYTASKNYIYKPHTAYGLVGRTSAGYLAQRRRL